MEEVLATAPDSGAGARRALALPADAWPARTAGLGALLGKPIATLLALYGALRIAIVFRELSAIPASSKLFQVGEGLVWIVFATGVWARSPSRLRKAVASLMILEGAEQFGWFAFSAEPFHPLSLTLLVTLLSWICIGIDVGRGREWARRACMVLALASYGYGLFVQASAWTMFGDRTLPRDPIFMTFLVMAAFIRFLPSITLAIYAVLPSTRADFAQAREAA
jgi:hypothetical protein